VAKKGSAKRYMQQRINIAASMEKLAASKEKLVNYVKETHIEPIKKDLDTPKEPRAKFGSMNGRLSTYLGLDEGQLESDSRNDALAQGIQDGTRHIPTYLSGAADKHPEGVTGIADGLLIKAKRTGEK
jgi:hypothetical protein